MLGDIIIACLLILYFLLCRCVIRRAEKYFGKLLNDVEKGDDF